jgi:SAM-dependent methyltransferase
VAVEYDPSQFTGTAPYYLAGRPPYSADLGRVLAEELGLDGTGTLVDVGAGPGILAAELGPLVERVVVVEPDAGMLAEARRHLATRGLTQVDFIQATAEELPKLGLSPARLVTFGQSFHRVDRLPVAEAVHDLLEPAGAMVLVTNDYRSAPRGPLPTDPPVPHEEIRELIRRFLGEELRSGARTVASYVPERFEETLARTPFGRPDIVYAAGRTDIIRDIDGVIAAARSMSYAAPHLFGDRFDDFLAQLRELLEQLSPTGSFWEWAGDTEIVIARKR